MYIVVYSITRGVLDWKIRVYLDVYNSARFILYSFHCITCNALFTLYGVHCTLYTIHFTMHSRKSIADYPALQRKLDRVSLLVADPPQ